MKSLSECFLYGILDLGYLSPKDCERTAHAMLEGGVDIFQLRAKGHPPSIIKELASALAPIFWEQDIPFIINDHPELVKETGATGFHGGQDDLPLIQARALAGEKALAGCSTHNLAQAQTAYTEGADYIGFGPLFPTPTKQGRLAIGLENIKKVHEIIPLPIFCIGGIKRENLPAVIQAGARRVTIVSAILQASDIRGYCQDCKALISAL